MICGWLIGCGGLQRLDVEILYGYGGSGFLLSLELRIGLGDDGGR